MQNVYAPVFNYYYNGTSYNVKLDKYSNVDVPMVGDYEKNYINPDNQEDVYRTSVAQNISVLGIWIGFIISSLIELYLVLWK